MNNLEQIPSSEGNMFHIGGRREVVYRNLNPKLCVVQIKNKTKSVMLLILQTTHVGVLNSIFC